MLRLSAGMLALVLMLAGTSREASAAVWWGSRGAQVRQVQKKLKQWGYFDGAVDGIFGRLTKGAVIAFQQYLGIEETGEKRSKNEKNEDCKLPIKNLQKTY